MQVLSHFQLKLYVPVNYCVLSFIVLSRLELVLQKTIVNTSLFFGKNLL